MSEDVQSRCETVEDVVFLTLDGVLDSDSYRGVRDSIVKAALDTPRAVIVDITGLRAPVESALSVFTSARWLIGRWPDVPLLLVCQPEQGRNALVRNGITRYVPLYASFTDAADALAQHGVSTRNRIRVELSGQDSRLPVARQVVSDWLQERSRTNLLSVAKMGIGILVENALQHTDGGPVSLRLETKDDEVTVAIEDASSVSPSFREKALGGDELTGLKILDAISRAWGCNPSPGGKVVWCVFGPENQL